MGQRTMSKKKEDNEEYMLTEWGCLSSILEDYGIDTSHIKGKVGKHIVEDFMDAMVKAGHVLKAGNKDEYKTVDGNLESRKG